MASLLKLCDELNGHTVPVLAASNTGVLPLDAVYEILLRLPAKELCRLRIVCRFWRSLLSDPLFAAAHADRLRKPLIVLGYTHKTFDSVDSDDELDIDYENLKHASLINIMDLSGNILKQVRMDGHIVMSMPLNHVCIRRVADGGSCRLVNPATGADMYYVREKLAEEHLVDFQDGLYLFGQVASTREYKAFRKVTYLHFGEYEFLYEVCTLNGSSHEPWRPIQGPPNTYGWCESTSAVIDGVVYFLTSDAYSAIASRSGVVVLDWIVSFDLETEKWRPNIRGPQIILPNNVVDVDHHDGLIQEQLSLANLNGSLVIVHGPNPCMDLWFLVDFEKGLWTKQYSIQIERYGSFWYLHPLIVLDDERIVLHMHIESSQMLAIYHPRTNNFSNVADVRHCRAISVYTGSLLSLD